MTLLQYSTAPAVHPRSIPLKRLAGPVALLVLCLFFSALRWLKMESFWGDAPRWIFEAWRTAEGEVPYRDFAWQYPPLALLLFGAALHIFGNTFAVIQIVIDLVSTAVVLAEWRIANRLLSPGLALAVVAALTCAGAGNTGNFALFSLRLYTPAILLGMLGLLLTLDTLCIFLQSRSLAPRELFWLGVGSTIALLSKPEFIIGTLGALAAVALIQFQQTRQGDRCFSVWLQRQIVIFAIAFLPALLIYAGYGWRAGLTNLIAGVGGYGMAFLVCPWWPTGLGILGAAVALLQAGLVLSVVRAFSRSEKLSRFPRAVLAASAVLAIPASALYLPYCVRELPVFAGGLTAQKIVSFYLSAGTVLMPVMWSSILLWVALAIRVIRGKLLPDDATLLFVLASAAIMMSFRTLFSGTLNQISLVTVAAYPVWFLLVPPLIQRSLQGPVKYPLRRASAPVVLLLVGYGVLRFGAAVVSEPPSHYTAVQTGAGMVHLLDRGTSPAVYRYVLEHTSDRDTVLDVAYGGVVNFMAHRRSPIYSTQFSALAPAQRYLALDLARISAHPPTLVIASDMADFGATYGMCVETGCMFPELVWRPTRLACEVGKTFPVLDFIKMHYTPAIHLGDKIVYTADSSLRAAD